MFFKLTLCEYLHRNLTFYLKIALRNALIKLLKMGHCEVRDCDDGLRGKCDRRSHYDNDRRGHNHSCCSFRTSAYVVFSVLSVAMILYAGIVGSYNYAAFINAPLPGGRGLIIDADPAIAYRANEYLTNIFLCLFALLFSLIAILCGISKLHPDFGHHRKHKTYIAAILIGIVFLVLVAIVVAILVNGIGARGIWVSGLVMALAAFFGILSTLYFRLKWYAFMMLTASVVAIGVTAYILIVVPSSTSILGRRAL